MSIVLCVLFIAGGLLALALGAELSQLLPAALALALYVLYRLTKGGGGR